MDIWRGALGVIYAPKVATGLSPGFELISAKITEVDAGGRRR